MPDDRTDLRLSISLSGGAALGAYHAGVLAALITGVQTLALEDAVDVRIDAIGGASAGALASMFGAHALLHGLDPVELLSEAWVEQVSLDLLRAHGPRAPLGFSKLRERLPHDLQPHRWRKVAAGPQPSPVGIHVSLTGLRGLRYWLETVDGRRIRALTYADWGEFFLQPDGGVEQLLEPEGASVLDFVLASAANPAAFAPELLDRGPDREAYESRNIEDLPADARLWYTDGSSISSEPIGRVLKLTNELEDANADATHVCLLVDPLSEIPEHDGAWTADSPRPSWLEGLVRTLEIMPEQVLHDDLRRTHDSNRRLELLARLVDALGPHLDAETAGALREALGDQVDIPHEASGDDALRAAVATVADLDGKVPVHLDLISPLLVADRHGRSAPGLLAGEIMGDFGGFLHRRLRRSDFALGYESLLAWLPRGLERAALAPQIVDATVEAVRDAQPAPWAEVEEGRTSTSDLPLSSHIGVARLAAQTVRVIATDIWRLIRS